MDPLRLASSVFILIDLGLKNSKYQLAVVSRNYGWPLGLLVSVFLRDTASRYARIEKDVLNGADEEAIAFKQAVTDECIMTAVAGAIIAQVAITALSLPGLSSTHWVARAFFLLSVTTGCLSVYYACVLQRVIGKLYRPESIRAWLKSPPVSEEDEALHAPRASLPAVFILSAPFTSVKYSIFGFLTGLAIYQGFTWTRGLDTSAAPGDSRDVFIAFTAGTGFFLLFFSATFSAKHIESLLRFGRTMLGPDASRNYHESESGIGHQQTRVPSRQSTRSPMAQQPHAHHSPDRVAYGDLVAVLDAAAKVHIQCAKADRQVAIKYTKVSSKLSNNIV